MHSIDLFGTEDDKEEQSCSPSLLIDTSRVCDEALGHKEGGNGSQIKKNLTFQLQKYHPIKKDCAFSLLLKKKMISMLMHIRKVRF